MSEINIDKGAGDPMGCLQSLADAASDPALEQFEGGGEVSLKARQAACRLATALGECRLFGVKPSEGLDGTLPPRMATAASEELIAQVSHARAVAERLPELWDECGDAMEAEELCLGLVEDRLSFWAATVALEEAFVGALDNSMAAASGLDRAWYQVLVEIERLDAAMQKQRSFLAVATETNLLDNWRGFLVAPHSDLLPWVLDGALEAAAAELETAALATRPQVAHTSAAAEVFEGAAADGGGLAGTAGHRDLKRQTPILRILEETMEHLAEAFRQQFRPEAMRALAADSDKKKEVKVLWDSKQDLAPLRCIVYRERNGDLRLDFSSTDDTHENQTFEVVVKEQTRPTVTFRRDPQTRELFGEVRIPRDELPEADLSKLTFRLKKS